MDSSIDEDDFGSAFACCFQQSFLTLLKRTGQKTYIADLIFKVNNLTPQGPVKVLMHNFTIYGGKILLCLINTNFFYR